MEPNALKLETGIQGFLSAGRRRGIAERMICPFSIGVALETMAAAWGWIALM